MNGENHITHRRQIFNDFSSPVQTASSYGHRQVSYVSLGKIRQNILVYQYKLLLATFCSTFIRPSPVNKAYNPLLLPLV